MSRRTVRCKLIRDPNKAAIIVTATFDPSAPIVLTDIYPNLTDNEELMVLHHLLRDGKDKENHLIPPDLPQVEWFLNASGNCEMREIGNAND